jgi:hypothetical protein
MSLMYLKRDIQDLRSGGFIYGGGRNFFLSLQYYALGICWFIDVDDVHWVYDDIII